MTQHYPTPKTLFGQIVDPGGAKWPTQTADNQKAPRVIFPCSEGPDVKAEHKPREPTRKAPCTGSWCGRTDIAGTACTVDSQGPGAIVTGCFSDALVNTKQEMESNRKLLHPDVITALGTEVDWKIPPNIRETKHRGAKVRKYIEREFFKTDLLSGLPINSSLFSMLQQNLPQKKGIETAKEHFSNILGSGVLGGLPGGLSSLGNILNKIPSGSLNSEISTAFSSLANMIPSFDTDAGLETNGLMRVNEEVFLENATELLSQCRSLDDLNECIMEIYENESLRGLDTYEDTDYLVNTPFGTICHTISPSGDLNIGGRIRLDGVVSNTGNAWVVGTNTNFIGINSGDAIEFSGNSKTWFVGNVANGNYLWVTEELPELANDFIYLVTAETKTVRKAEAEFGGFMSSGSTSGGAPGIAPGENLFGESSGTMFDMFKRLRPEAMQKAMDVMKATNTNGGAKNRNDIMRLFSEGGSPIATFLQKIG